MKYQAKRQRDNVLVHTIIVNYSTELFNAFDLSCMQLLALTFKLIALPVIFFSETSIYHYDIKFSMKMMMSSIIEATVSNVKSEVEDILLPHIPRIPKDMTFEFKPF